MVPQTKHKGFEFEIPGVKPNQKIILVLCSLVSCGLSVSCTTVLFRFTFSRGYVVL